MPLIVMINRNGYTTNIDATGVFTEETLPKNRECDVAWPKDYTDQHLRKTVDVQDVENRFATILDTRTHGYPLPHEGSHSYNFWILLNWRRIVRHKITAIRDLRAVLRDIIPFVKNPKSLYTGRELPSISQRPREILANWLICAAASDSGESDWTFGEDPMGGDGLLIDRSTKVGRPTEHVFIPSPESPHNETVENLMANAVEHKHKKGEPYATGKCLVIFVEGLNRQWFPNDVHKRIQGRHHFDSVWAVGLQESDGNDYKYFVVCLDEYPCPCCTISVDLEKAEWIVERIQ